MLFPDGSSAGRSKTLNPQNSTFCFWTGSTSDGETHYVFLQKTQTSLLLYDSIWNKNNSLFSCITSNHPSAIKSYMSRCWDLRSSSFSESPDVRFNIRQLVKPDGPCQNAHNLKGISESVRKARELRSVDPDGSVQQDHGESLDLKLRRSKRALMIPGTVWCGSGNKASNFSELGMFQETDKCCREHDHCKETIASFSFDHGVFNTNIFTLSHCDCDNRFRHCLSGVNNTVSNIVGYGYFNVLKMRCFEFAHRMKCARRTWWGKCIFSKLTPYAVIKGPTNYTDALPEKDKHILEMSFRQTITLDDTQVTKNSEASLSVQASDSRSNSEALSPVPELPEPSVTTLWSRKSEPSILPTDTPKTTLPQYTSDGLQKGKFKVCDSYRDLDSCHLQIPALQEKFGLRNSDVRTMYHCNCTERLAQEISNMDEVDPVHFLLMDFVSQSCFVLPQSENCAERTSCSDSQAEAPVIQHWRKGVTQVRHLVDFNRNFRRMNLKRSKRKDSAVKLRKKCLRMHTKLHRTQVTEHKLL
ncbi:group 3 secretory phospholipase A2 [Triplophysa dalaica]|uniref:group 3 secretory phospholipase A2 n=1 Tax=Triplophysa dalaica TaxID=1582913 RepID=UPI0024DFBA5A|nr:group 3 secretory phospholipase A2 [Triplophysa dalaica]